MVKKLFTIIGITSILFGSAIPVLAVTQTKVGCSQFSIEKLNLKNIKKGKLLCGMKIVSVKKVIEDKSPLGLDNISIGLSGGIMLSGQFYSEGDSFVGMGAGNYFIPDQSTLKKYAFLSDSIVIANDNVNTLLHCKNGCVKTVKVTIDTYTINHAGTEVSDEVHVTKIVSIKPPIVIQQPKKVSDSCTSDTGKVMTYERALEIAKASSCNKVGTFVNHYSCNKNGGGMINVDMNPVGYPNCGFACRISIDTEKAKEGWMCVMPVMHTPPHP